MIPVTLSQLADVLDGERSGADVTLRQVTTDTRQLAAGQDALFVALKGERFDAHDFAAEAVAHGAAALLVDRPLPVAAPQLVVADTRRALGQLGGWVRQQVPARVVALTGSSGKTTVKEMTAAILRQCGNVLATQGNLNNDIGVPLTLLRLTPQHDFAVIELGANHQGEIAWTTALTRPQAALVNNLCAAHLEGFGSLEGVAAAKGEIFDGLPPTGIAIVNADSQALDRWAPRLAGRTVWRFSAGATPAEFTASAVRHAVDQSQFTLHTPLGACSVTLPLPGRHNVANALAAAALALAAGADLAAVQAGLASLQPVAGRLYPITLSEGKLILDDSYNANEGSMLAAVQTLSQMPGYRVLVAGDMAELGSAAPDCHRRVGEAAREYGIDSVLSVGTLSAAISQASGVGEHFSDKTALVARLRALLAEHAVITVLIKGSRSTAMEQVTRALQEIQTC